jgi:hypothetical protein
VAALIVFSGIAGAVVAYAILTGRREIFDRAEPLPGVVRPNAPASQTTRPTSLRRPRRTGATLKMS